MLERCWSTLERLGIVLEGIRGCWSGVGAAWKVLECVGMVLEWNGGCWSGVGAAWNVCWYGVGVY